MEAGRITWTDPVALARATADDDTRAGLFALAPDGFPGPGAAAPGETKLDPTRAHTVGQWATAPRCY
jgi:hypothetical protein